MDPAGLTGSGLDRHLCENIANIRMNNMRMDSIADLGVLFVIEVGTSQRLSRPRKRLLA
jgi:hypothetical protein